MLPRVWLLIICLSDFANVACLTQTDSYYWHTQQVRFLQRCGLLLSFPFFFFFLLPSNLETRLSRLSDRAFQVVTRSRRTTVLFFRLIVVSFERAATYLSIGPRSLSFVNTRYTPRYRMTR